MLVCVINDDIKRTFFRKKTILKLVHLVFTISYYYTLFENSLGASRAVRLGLAPNKKIGD